ncbi:hypothetical protein [Candidatus Lokiarchaeum ossiferum]|uniref:hypothetical protein n=1 Tax=Candidatus Lokiarchaeum ossiferum TaxID=2951803 RepID=UPI00352F6304
MKKKKVIITNNTVLLVLKKEERELRLFNQLDLYAPYQMESKLFRKFKYFKPEKEQRYLIEYQQLKKKIKFITIPDSDNIYEVAFQTIKVDGIWDRVKWKINGSTPIPYYSSKLLLQMIEEEAQPKDETIFAVEVESIYHQMLAPLNIKRQIAEMEWCKSKKEWDEKKLLDYDPFKLVINFLHFEGLLCLSKGEFEGKYMYYNGRDMEEDKDTFDLKQLSETEEITNIAFIDGEDPNKFPELPPLNKKSLEIWHIQEKEHPTDQSTFIEVKKMKEKLLYYWQIFLELDYSQEGVYQLNYRDFTMDTIVLDLNPNASDKEADDDWDYEELSLNQVLKRCNIELEKYKSIFNEYGVIALLKEGDSYDNCITFLISGLQRSLQTTRKEIDQEFEDFEKYYSEKYGK